MAIKSFTSTRPVTAGDGKRLAGWSVSAGAVAVKLRLCDGSAAVPLLEIQVPVNSASSLSYPSPPVFPLGLHAELVSGNLNKGMVDLI